LEILLIKDAATISKGFSAEIKEIGNLNRKSNWPKRSIAKDLAGKIQYQGFSKSKTSLEAKELTRCLLIKVGSQKEQLLIRLPNKI
jgi:hypothetical protein